MISTVCIVTVVARVVVVAITAGKKMERNEIASYQFSFHSEIFSFKIILGFFKTFSIFFFRCIFVLMLLSSGVNKRRQFLCKTLITDRFCLNEITICSDRF